ncbi:MAG: hypothetical protein HY674_03930 [Chloroflexi bacterium]|nr:hypothetical protein [Chloroflexota bacterium]
MSEAVPSDLLGFARKPDSRSVREAPWFAAELFWENAVLFLEIFDHRLLVSVQPASDGNQEELKLVCHGAKKHSKTMQLNASDGRG